MTIMACNSTFENVPGNDTGATKQIAVQGAIHDAQATALAGCSVTGSCTGLNQVCGQVTTMWRIVHISLEKLPNGNSEFSADVEINGRCECQVQAGGTFAPGASALSS